MSKATILADLYKRSVQEYTRVTVICEGLTKSNPLFTVLLNSGVGNIVCDTEINAIQQEISECLSESGMAAQCRSDCQLCRSKCKAVQNHDYKIYCRGVMPRL